MGGLAAVPLWLWYSRWGLAEAMDGRDERATQEQKSLGSVTHFERATAATRLYYLGQLEILP